MQRISENSADDDAALRGRRRRRPETQTSVIQEAEDGEEDAARPRISTTTTATELAETKSGVSALLSDSGPGEGDGAEAGEEATVSRGQPKERDEEDGRSWLVSLSCPRISVPKSVWNALPAKDASWVDRRSIYGLPMLHPFHPAAVAWMLLMLVFDLVYTAFWVPLSVGFCVGDVGWTLTAGCTQANFFGGLIYLINTLLSFQIGAVLEYDYQDYYVTDGRILAHSYVRHGRFLIDLLATIPFIALVVLIILSDEHSDFGSSFLFMLTLLRLFRLARLVSISKVVYFNSKNAKGAAAGGGGLHISVTTTYIILLVYLLAVVINLEACIMLMVARLEGLEESWMISVGWKDFITGTDAQQWYYAIYWIVTTSTTTGYGDVTPKSITEQVIANVYMMLGLVIFGLLVGTISNVTTRASNEAHKLHTFRKKLNRVVQWLHSHGVPNSTKKQVRAYFSGLWAARAEMSLDAEIFNDLPHYLRHELSKHAMLPSVSTLRLFKSQERELQQLVAQYMRPVDVAPGSDLCQQGEEGDRLWMLVEGEVSALQHLRPPLTLVADPGHPCVIGDSIIMAHDIPASRNRSFTIRTLNHVPCKIWELRVANLWSIMRMYPSICMDMMDHVRNRTLVEIAAANREQGTEAQEGPGAGAGPGPGPGPGGSVVKSSVSGSELTSWCEAAASVSRALLHQSQDFVDLTMEELRKAKLLDGSLPQLLDTLLEFSINHSHKQVDMSSLLNSQAQQGYATGQGQGQGQAGGDGGAVGQRPGSSSSSLASGVGGSESSQPWPGSGPGSGSGSQFSVAGERVRAALGRPAGKAAWKPGRLGRQTLFRLSSLAGNPQSLASSSIPVQEFGVGYTNYG